MFKGLTIAQIQHFDKNYAFLQNSTKYLSVVNCNRWPINEDVHENMDGTSKNIKIANIWIRGNTGLI